MLRFIVLLMFTCLVSQAFSQKSRSPETRQNLSNELIKIEQQILTLDTDQEAISYIKAHYSMKDKIYDYKVNIMNAYDQSLTKSKKERKFTSENRKNKELKKMKQELLNAEIDKKQFLSSKYPEYNKFFSRLGSRRK